MPTIVSLSGEHSPYGTVAEIRLFDADVVVGERGVSERREIQRRERVQVFHRAEQAGIVGLEGASVDGERLLSERVGERGEPGRDDALVVDPRLLAVVRARVGEAARETSVCTAAE